MPRAPKRHALTGCRRRKPKHQVHPNERWVHLSSRQAGQMGMLQTVMATTSLFCMYLCTGFSQNTYAEDTSGYIVGTYIISD